VLHPPLSLSPSVLPIDWTWCLACHVESPTLRAWRPSYSWPLLRHETEIPQDLVECPPFRGCNSPASHWFDRQFVGMENPSQPRPILISCGRSMAGAHEAHETVSTLATLLSLGESHLASFFGDSRLTVVHGELRCRKTHN